MKYKRIMMTSIATLALFSNISFADSLEARHFSVLSEVLSNQSIQNERIAEKTTNINVDETDKYAKYFENNSLLQSAFLEYGKPYQYGSKGPDSFDCSGFVQFVFNKESIKVPRTSKEQSVQGMFISRDELQVGDLIFFDTRYYNSIPTINVDEKPETTTIFFEEIDEVEPNAEEKIPSVVTHVGIYIGDDRFIHASTSDKGVTVDSLASKYYSQRYLSASRYR